MPDLDPYDRDQIARTILSEAGNDGDDGMVGVANVIKNRVDSGKFASSPADVIHQRNVFEPWSLPRNSPNNPNSISTKSPAYQKAAAIADSVWSGTQPDTTGGATHFFSPSDQKALGRNDPDWASGQPLATIGHHQFYAPDGPVAHTPDFLGNLATQSATPPAATAGPPSDDPLAMLAAKTGPSAAPDPSAAPATFVDAQGRPHITVTPATVPAQPTVAPEDETVAQTVNRTLAEHQGDDWTDRAIRLGVGGVRGIGDVADTLAKGIAAAGTGGANILQQVGAITPATAGAVQNWGAGVNQGIAANDATFGQESANSPLAQAGRIGGQIAGSAPFLEMGGAALGATGAPAALAGRPVLGTIARGALTGAGASALTSAASDQSFGDQAGMGAMIGGVLGPLGYGASRLGGMVRNGVLGSVSPETAALAQRARNVWNIPVSAGQIATSPAARFADSVFQRLPLSGYGARTEAIQNSFNRAVSNTWGDNVGSITPATIRTAQTRIGQTFNDVANRTGPIHVDNQFLNDMHRIETDAGSVLPASEMMPLRAQLRNIGDTIDAPTASISPESYQALTRKDAPLSRAQQSKDPNIRYYAGQVRDMLDDVMQRSAPPDAVQDLVEARQHYKALKTVEPLAKKSTTGDISPASLLGAVNKSYRGDGGHLGELGRIGQRFIKEPPSSGTAERLLTMKLTGAALGALGAGGAAYFDPENFQRDMVYGVGALAGGRAGSALLRSNALTNSMIRGGLNPAGAAQPFANLLSRAAPGAALTYRAANGAPGQ